MVLSLSPVCFPSHPCSLSNRCSFTLYLYPAFTVPIRPQAKYYMVNIYRGGMYVLAVLAGEMPPLFVLEFLHRIWDIFQEYFGEVSESEQVSFSLVLKVLCGGLMPDERANRLQ